MKRMTHNAKSKPTKRPPRTPKLKDEPVEAAQAVLHVGEELIDEELDLNGEDVEEIVEPDDESLVQQEYEFEEDEDIFDLRKAPQLAA